MSLIQRATRYIIRKKARSILLFVIVFLTASLILASLVIRTACAQAERELRQSMGSSFNLEVNANDPSMYETVEHESGVYSYQRYTGPVITAEMRDRIMDIDGVSAYNVYGSEIFSYVDVDMIPGGFMDAYLDTLENNPDETQIPFRLADYQVDIKTTLLFGENDSSLNAYFRSGAFSLAQGRHIRQGDAHKAVISTQLADRNGLRIGDTFTAEIKEGNYMPSDDPMRVMGEPVTLEVVGLYDVNFEQEVSAYTYESGIAANYILVDTQTVAELTKNTGAVSGREAYGMLTFFVDDPEQLDRVLGEVRALDGIEWQYYTLEPDDTAYRASAQPLNQISAMTSFLVVALALGVLLVLYLLFSMWTKGRRREIGVLLSIGLKKTDICLQMILEGTIIAAAALLLAFALSGVVVDAAAHMIEASIQPGSGTELFTAYQELGRSALIIDKVAAEPVALDTFLGAGDAGIVVSLTFGVMAAGITAASGQIFRLKPKEIMTA